VYNQFLLLSKQLCKKMQDLYLLPLLPPIPQASGSSGAQTGTGIALVLATAILVWLEAEAIWVEAAAPVRARTTTKVRTMSFMS
jgi:hypothetical protein